MDIHYRSHTFQVAECDLIVMGDNFYAKVDLGQRGLSYPHYIKVTPSIPQAFDSGLDYCYPQPAPKPLIVVLTPEMAAHVNASALVEIVVQKPLPVISLFSEALLVA